MTFEAAWAAKFNPRSGSRAAWTGLLLGDAMDIAAAQEDCPRGQLDNAYCDRDGDMVADAEDNCPDVANHDQANEDGEMRSAFYHINRSENYQHR